MIDPKQPRRYSYHQMTHPIVVKLYRLQNLNHINNLCSNECFKSVFWEVSGYLVTIGHAANDETMRLPKNAYYIKHIDLFKNMWI